MSIAFSSSNLVAPHAGAWIEISSMISNGLHVMSLPMRERGLKLVAVVQCDQVVASLPMRERGLKERDGDELQA